MTAASEIVVKVLRLTEWSDTLTAGRFDGSSDDQRDGFIHFSTPEQLAGTLERHYAQDFAVVAVIALTRDLGSELQWEQSRGGALFPHLYGPLKVSAIAARVLLDRISLAADFALPGDFAGLVDGAATLDARFKAAHR